MRQPVRCPRTGLWLARYQEPDGRIRQAGRFERKRDAAQAIFEATRVAQEAAAGELPEITVREFFERWPRRFPRHPRTTSTNAERLERRVFPFLPGQGDFPLSELRRSMLREVMAALLARGLSKGTIDGTFASLSAMLSDAVDDEVTDANPARALAGEGQRSAATAEAAAARPPRRPAGRGGRVHG